MASLDQIEKQISGLTSEEIERLVKDIKGIKKEVEAKEGQERAKQLKKEISIDDKVQYKRSGKAQTGVVEAVLRDGVRVRVNDGRRARTIKWYELVGKK